MPTDVKTATQTDTATDRPQKIFLLPYAHCDNAWSHTRRWHEDRYTQIFHEVLDIMNRDPDYKWYFDTAYEELSPFARRAPERMPELRRRIQEGRIEVAPNAISNPAIDSVGGETFIRNMVYGRRYFERVFGTKTEVYTANDLTPGHSQMPQLLQKGGYRYYRFTRPSLNELVDFSWEGLDGTRILSSRGGYGYGTLADGRAFPHDFLENWARAAAIIYDEIRQQFSVIYKRGKPVDKVQIGYSSIGNAGIVWLSRGGDDCRPLRDLRGKPLDIIGLVREWNKREPVPLQFATPTEYFTELEKHRDELPVISGVLDSSGCACRFGMLGNASLFVWWFRDEIEITTAERLVSLQSLGLDRAYPEQRFDKLWNGLFTTTGHAIRLAFTNDYDRLLARQKRIHRRARALSQAAMASLAARIHHPRTGTPIVVFNSLAWDRRDVATVALELVPGSTRWVTLSDYRGHTVPFQVSGQELHPDSTLKRLTLVFIAEVGSLGYATYYAEPHAEPPASQPVALGEQQARPATLTVDNRYFEVVIDRGAIRSIILSNQSANLLDTQTMAANAISYSTLDPADDFDTLGPFTSEAEERGMETVAVEDGPVFSRIVARGAIGEHAIRKEVIVYREVPRIDVTAEIDSKGGDGVFKAKFPLGFDGTMVGHVPFGAEVVDRAKEPCGTNFANASYPHSFSAERWVDYSGEDAGVAIMSSPGQTGFDYDPEQRVAKHILLKTRTIPKRTTWRHISRYQECKGLQRVRYSLYPHRGDWRRAQVHRRASEFQEPLRWTTGETRPAPPAPGTSRGARTHGTGTISSSRSTAPARIVAPAASFVQIRPQSVVMTAMYRHGQAVVLRMYESHGERSQVELTLPFEVGVAEESDFYGDRLDPGTPITVAERQVSFAIQPWQIVTLYVRPVSKPRANAKGSE